MKIPLRFHPLARSPQLTALLRWCVVGLVCALLLLAMLPQPVLAAGAPPGGAYRLKVGTLVEFDPRSGTVGDAIKSLLEPVQYRITYRTVDPVDSAAVLQRRIPAIAAHAGVMSIEQALLLLIGEDNRLVVDHVNRLVAVERLPDDAKETR